MGKTQACCFCTRHAEKATYITIFCPSSVIQTERADEVGAALRRRIRFRSEKSLEKTTAPVSIVMPCLNEAATVGQCVSRAREALGILSEKHGLLGEVIAADNG